MLNHNARKLVEALKSSGFEQGQDCLRTGDRYCPLGLGCELFRREHPEWQWATCAGPRSYFVDPGQDQVRDRDCVQLPDAVTEWLGFNSPTGGFFLDVDLGDGVEGDSITVLNDTGASFAQIAAVIEAEPEGLFALLD